MSNVLNEMQQLRLLLAKESNFYLAKAEKVYNFIVGEQPNNVVELNDGRVVTLYR